MKYIKSIFEGAKLLLNFDGMPQTSELNVKDDGDKLEYLKTSRGSYVKSPAELFKGSFNIYYGLELDEKLKPMIKDAKTGAKHRVILKILSDFLKSTNIKGGIDSLVNFMSSSIKTIDYEKRIDYVIPLGSTQSLSEDMASAVKQILPNTNIDPVDKMIFKDIVSALDWNYILNYDDRVVEEGIRPIVNMVKGYVRREIVNDESGEGIIQAIRDARTGAELKSVLLKSNKNHPDYKDEYKITWKTPNFIVRSSGIAFGGSRSIFKNKYYVPTERNTVNNPRLYNIVKDVVLNNKSMLIVDDNVSSKIDMKSVFKSIETIAYNILEDQGAITDYTKNIKALEWTKRVNAYVLINLDRNKMGTQEEILLWADKLTNDDD